MTSSLNSDARRPLSHAKAGTGACEGKQASPSNPTEFAGANSCKDHRVHMIRCRLNASEMAHVEELSAHRGITISELTRDALGLSQARKRKPVTSVDPALLRQLISTGTNINQIARAVNSQFARLETI